MTKKPKNFNPFWTNFFSKHHLDEDYKNKIYQFYEKDIQIDGKRIIGTTFFNENFSESEKLQYLSEFTQLFPTTETITNPPDSPTHSLQYNKKVASVPVSPDDSVSSIDNSDTGKLVSVKSTNGVVIRAFSPGGKNTNNNYSKSVHIEIDSSQLLIDGDNKNCILFRLVCLDSRKNNYSFWNGRVVSHALQLFTHKYGMSMSHQALLMLKKIEFFSAISCERGDPTVALFKSTRGGRLEITDLWVVYRPNEHLDDASIQLHVKDIVENVIMEEMIRHEKFEHCYIQAMEDIKRNIPILNIITNTDLDERHEITHYPLRTYKGISHAGIQYISRKTDAKGNESLRSPFFKLIEKPLTSFTFRVPVFHNMYVSGIDTLCFFLNLEKDKLNDEQKSELGLQIID